MQILSIVQWYHFAYMVISVALLGFGAVGTLLSLFRKKLLNQFQIIFPLLLILTGITMSLVVRLAQIEFFRFDTYLAFTDYIQFLKLLITYLLFFIPFCLGALSIGLVFIKHPEIIGKLYFL